jgi:hypothetical protein
VRHVKARDIALLDYAVQFLIGVLAVIVAELALYRYFKRREQAKIEIHSSIRKDGLGIQVETMNKTLKDARVLLNGVPYPWRMPDGSEVARRDIFVGELPPAEFVPYRVKAENITEDFKSKEGERSMWVDIKAPPRVTDPLPEGAHAMRYVITEITTEKEFVSFSIVTSERARKAGGFNLGNVSKYISDERVSIRIVADGIEEVRDYVMALNMSGLVFTSTKDGQNVVGIGFDFVEV